MNEIYQSDLEPLAASLAASLVLVREDKPPREMFRSRRRGGEATELDMFMEQGTGTSTLRCVMSLISGAAHGA